MTPSQDKENSSECSPLHKTSQDVKFDLVFKKIELSTKQKSVHAVSPLG